MVLRRPIYSQRGPVLLAPQPSTICARPPKSKLTSQALACRAGLGVGLLFSCVDLLS